jgi:hypothetical protein
MREKMKNFEVNKLRDEIFENVQQCRFLVPTKYDPLILPLHIRYAPLLIKFYKFIILLHVLGMDDN